jgi:hypothetical protein
MAYGTALLKQTKKGFYKIFVWDFMEGQLLSGGCSFFMPVHSGQKGTNIPFNIFDERHHFANILFKKSVFLQRKTSHS